MKQKYPKEQIVKEFKKLVRKLRKIPTQEDLKKLDFVVCPFTLHRKSGSYNDYIISCGFKPNKVMGDRIDCVCKQCSKSFSKVYSKYKKSQNHFCSQSCSGIYNNAHKTKGTSVSKLEKYLQQELTKLYPTLEIHYNRKDAINSELDIYIPTLKLAFELNGIFHYEPIFGEETLMKIQNNDSRKYQACIEKGISLCVIDSSGMKHFKPNNSKKYLDIILNIVEENLKNGTN